jgi:hypothetical protein
MEDGGMGSLYIVSERERSERKLGRALAEITFSDIDGVDVLVTLNIDQFGEIFELDIWKTDFSKTIKLPD